MQPGCYDRIKDIQGVTNQVECSKDVNNQIEDSQGIANQDVCS
jgi:hypothetical protein